MQIDLYTYVAANEPRRAKKIIESFGYQCRSRNLAQNLRELVMNEGEEAVQEIMLIHPDFEYFSANAEKPKKKLAKKEFDNYQQNQYAYLNATGNEIAKQNISSQIGNQTSLMILAAAMMLTVAIISKK